MHDHRQRTLRRSLAVAGVVAVLAAVAVGCSGDADDDDGPFALERSIGASAATGLAVVPGGDLVIGELSTGRIIQVDLLDDDAQPEELTTLVDLDDTPEQGGLLGLAALDADRLAVAYTAQDGTIRIDELDAGSGRITAERWAGPASQERANGGRMAVLGDTTLLIGIGDLLDPDLIDDPDAPNGKVLAVAPDGTTEPWATGFNNPFALAGDGERTLWIADNAPGSRPERLLRVTEGEIDEVTSWEDTRVPSGVAVLADGTVAICSFATGELGIVDPDDPGDGRGQVVADDCRYGVAALPDGGLAYAAEDEVRILSGPDTLDDD